jgi:WD40 repeat protein
MPTFTVTPSPTPEPINRRNWQDIKIQQVIGDGELRNVVWSPDGKIMVIGFSQAIRILNALDNSEIAYIRSPDFLGQVNISPDGRVVVAAVPKVDNSTIRMWDSQIGEHMQDIFTTDGLYIYAQYQFGSDRLTRFLARKRRFIHLGYKIKSHRGYNPNHTCSFFF